MNDKLCNKNIIIKSDDFLHREEYDGKLSQEDVKLLQSNQCGFEYSIKHNSDYKSCEIAEIIIKFYQSFEIIEILTKMTAIYDISLIYSNHTIKFNNCFPRGIRSLSDGDNVLVEIKFICKAKPGLPVEFEHFRS
jgi:hypothetical protein